MRLIKTILLGTLCVIGAMLPSIAEARHGHSRSSGISIGIGTGSFGYRNYGYGYGYRTSGIGISIGSSRWYSPVGYWGQYGGPYYHYSNYTVPTYVNYSAPTYVYRAQSPVIVERQPVVVVPHSEQAPIQLSNPINNPYPIQYTLNGYVYTIKPGQSQKLQTDRQWVVEFDGGMGRGTLKYSLIPGVFRFRFGADGSVELYQARSGDPSGVQPPAPLPQDD